mmetsp:Transcript_27649/g.31013  ORF Transcript_27649/g.31013 Transcript_27649/m.31013 type:complete len:526 (+) Transcript_27649:90-1667(+)
MGIFQRSTNTSTSSSSTKSERPLPLKQRTSSKDSRRDYSQYTWTSLFVLLKTREFFVTVDNFSIWRRHLSWAMENGKDLRTYMQQRYASNMVFMSLLLSTELGILFNSSAVTTGVRHHLRNGDHSSLSFWAGFVIIISALMTILSLISTFTAWAMFNSVDANNAHCVFRSSIGQCAAALPGNLIVCSIYSFLISFILYFFLLLPFGIWSIMLLASTLFLFVYIVSVFSALGRLIMHTGAMGDSCIFTPEYEEFLLPHSLQSNLLAKAKANLENKTSIIRQYRIKQQPIPRFLAEDELYDYLCDRLSESSNGCAPLRTRADSTVRFADEEEGRFSSKQKVVRSPSTLSDISFDQSISSPKLSPPAKPDSDCPKHADYAERPPLVSDSKSLGANALRSVCNSSLEKWLQVSPKNSFEGGDQLESKFSERSSTPNNQDTKTDISSIPRPCTPVSSCEIHMEKDSFHQLTQDERFDLEYGNTDEAICDPLRRSNDEVNDIGGEKTSLLRNNNKCYPYFSYGDTSAPPPR